MQVSIWLLFVVVILWSMVLIVHAIRFAAGPLSPYELKRRTDAGDNEAALVNERERLLPRLQAFQQLVEAILAVVVISLTITALGWVLGVLLATLLFVARERLSRMTLVRRGADYLRSTYEQLLQEAVVSWRWLDYLQGVTDAKHDVTATSRDELYHIIEMSADVLAEAERHRLAASRHFDVKTVRDVMTPVSVVDTVQVQDSLGPLVLDELHKTGHSRFPVIDGDVHHVVGILYLHDIINLKSAKATVKESMDARVHYIHENQSLEHALSGFLKSHFHMFVVVNEYRETVGVLTLEDVIESLLGRKIIDEFDRYDDLRAVAESNPRKNNLPKGKTDV